MQTCCLCKESLPLTSFNKTSRSRTGFQQMCRTCNKGYQSNYREMVTSQDPFKAILRITAVRLSKIKKSVDLGDWNALKILCNNIDATADSQVARETREHVYEMARQVVASTGEYYNSKDIEIDHIIGIKYFKFVEDGILQEDALKAALGIRNVQLLPRAQHRAKTAEERRSTQPVLTEEHRLELHDIIP